jgi:hypothetical protein
MISAATRHFTGRCPSTLPLAQLPEQVRIECVRTMTVNADEADAWHQMLRYTGLRAVDCMRRALRILLFVNQAQQRGAQVLVREADGSETLIVVV